MHPADQRLLLFRVDYSSRRDPSIPQTLLAMTGEEHDNRRRLWNRGMSHESLVEYEGLIANHAGQLVARLQEESHRGHNVVDIVKWINLFTFDFMGDMAYVDDRNTFALRHSTH